ncbi:MAG: zinc-binding dehydrogenase [Isosphaeraceae bacterium]
MTRTTTAAVFHGAGTALEIREFPLPALRDGEILVEVIACTLCGSDLHSLHGRRAVPIPTILGHETLGRVAEFGPNAARHDAGGRPMDVGDRVTWGIVASCGACFYCRRRLPQKCGRQTKYGHEALSGGRELTGGLAGHCVLVPGTAVFVVPEGLSDAAACPANCAGATVAAALEAGGALEGTRVLVMGSGMLGVTATAWARARGAEHVITCDIAPARLSLAATFGATHTATPEDLARIVVDCTGGHGVDVAIEMTGSPESVEALPSLTRMGGTVVLVGSVFPSRSISLSPEQLVRRCLTVRGIHNYAPGHLHAALAFLAAHPLLPFSGLVFGWEPLSALAGALAEPLPPDRLRLGIRPGR